MSRTAIKYKLDSNKVLKLLDNTPLKNTYKNYLKAHANGRNKCQQLPTLLHVVGQQCCVRLHGPKSLTGSMQTDATNHNIGGPNNVGCCWPTILGPFA